MQRKITKIKLTDAGKINASYEEIVGENGQTNEVELKAHATAHPDLVAKFGQLKIHLATLCEQGDMTAYEDEPEKLDIFEVTQISFGGEDEHSGITITGMRRLRDNRILNLNAPFVKLHPDHSHYPYVSSLEMIVQELLVEADEYLNGKCAPSPQLNLFEPNEDEAEQEEQPQEEAPKRRRRTKKLDADLQNALGDVEVTVEV